MCEYNNVFCILVNDMSKGIDTQTHEDCLQNWVCVEIIIIQHSVNKISYPFLNLPCKK